MAYHIYKKVNLYIYIYIFITVVQAGEPEEVAPEDLEDQPVGRFIAHTLALIPGAHNDFRMEGFYTWPSRKPPGDGYVHVASAIQP